MRTHFFIIILVNAFTITAYGDVLLTEGFEGGAVPPTGWTLDSTVGSYTWDIESRPTYVHSGTYSAGCPYQSGQTQDEKLITPSVDISPYPSANLSFWWFGSTYYAQYANLYVRVSTDGSTYENIWEIPYSVSGEGSHRWTQQQLSLSDYAGSSTLYIMFRYYGDGGDWVFVDDISIESADAVEGASLGEIKTAFR
ncbi:MAG: hypothetical protein GY771_00065 [bacterium]|nr:hypothetical protein [bacterium]